MTILVVRHGETDDNAARILQRHVVSLINCTRHLSASLKVNVTGAPAQV
jgi:broad specificity phosphatase PhoE